MLKIPNVTGEVPRSKNQNLVKYNWMKIDWKLTENWMKIEWKLTENSCSNKTRSVLLAY